MGKIKMTTPLVEMDGDEMTRILWKMIKDELLIPYIDLKTEYYDLGLEHRNETDDQVTVDTARRGLQDVRRSVRKLKPDALERMSLNNAIHQMIEDMSKVTNTKIYFVSYMEELEFEADEEEVIYRIIQESTTNAIRHGKATEIWIRISEKDEELMIIISDNGCGCESIKEGFGLKHIRERVELLNGEVNYQGMIGFTIIAKIPIRNKLTGKKDRDELNNLADNNDKAKDSQ